MLPDCDIHFTRALAPFPHINTGHMLFRSTAFSSLFLRAVWSLDVFTHHPSWEQQAVIHLVDHYRFQRVRISPNRVFNSLGHVPDDPDPYQGGDFIIHFPGVPNKAELMSRYAESKSKAHKIG
jgi:hypothetical protein